VSDREAQKLAQGVAYGCRDAFTTRIPHGVRKLVDSPHRRFRKVDVKLPLTSFEVGFALGLCEQGGCNGEKCSDQGGVLHDELFACVPVVIGLNKTLPYGLQSI
jgi:hypothetical protein